MLNDTIVCMFSGVGIFGLGVHGHRYMQARVFGGWNRLRITRDLTGQYRVLIREKNAPLWPLILFRVCIPLGAAIAFASILWVK
jgi:hypothetical protein